MDLVHQLAEYFGHLRQAGLLAWPATIGLVGVVLATQWGANYAMKNEVPPLLLDILEGLSNRDLSSRK